MSSPIDASLLLLSAAEEGNVEDAIYALQKGADIHTEDWYGDTPLIYALEKSYTDVLEVLLKAGAAPDFRFSNGEPLLITAVMRCDVDVVRLLVDMGADVNVQNIHGDTPLLWAVRYCSVEIFKILVDAGADVNVQNIHGDTPSSTVKESVMRLSKILRIMGIDDSQINSDDDHL